MREESRKIQKQSIRQQRPIRFWVESCFAFLHYYYNVIYGKLNPEDDIFRTFSRLAYLFSMSTKNALFLVRCEYQLGSCDGSIDG